KQSLFRVSPSELVFENFVAHEVSEMELALTNKDKVSAGMWSFNAVLEEGSGVIPIGYRKWVFFCHGDDTKCSVLSYFLFLQDYSHELVCITKRERIVVPIRAIGARAILNIPDQLDFSKCWVKCSTQKTLMVHNTGNLEAHYQISTQSPFSVVPTTGTLGAGDSMQVTVEFHPLTTGDHFGSVVVCYNKGECWALHGAQDKALDVNIGLSTYSVDFKKTFITMSNHTTMFIENRSNITAHFQWKTFLSEEDDNREKRRLEGVIGPNSSAEIKVTFKPQKALEYRSVAYCNISGRGSRLPLHLRGEGQGPVVEFSRQMLKLGNIFVNTSHVYEVKLINQGVLDAPFVYIPSTTNVGCCFKFTPEKGVIEPGGIQTIQISFSATILGVFEEQFHFSVSESPTPVILTIGGCVSGPTLHFDVGELHFGDISFGFPHTMTCRLTNTSPVSVTYKLRMSDDGTQPAVSSFDQICKEGDPSWRKGIHFYVEPREFTMNPSQGTILPQGHQDIEVTLCSNTVMEYYRKMLVDLVGLEGIGKEVASVIISARYLHFPGLSQHTAWHRVCWLQLPREVLFNVLML
uniref:HYDIN/VesB/CFA65-like Ig-like domain-containing protein n=1 Tax=Cyanistes caeruleus TaxID=156563 RepID=A0A8C0ZHX8_CYACU